MDTRKVALDGSPCPLMATMVSQFSDGTLSGVRLWFTERHLRHCVRCTGALISLIDLEARLHAHSNYSDYHSSSVQNTAVSPLPTALRTQIREALDRIDNGACKPDF